jgi:hypothetical protein
MDKLSKIMGLVSLISSVSMASNLNNKELKIESNLNKKEIRNIGYLGGALGNLTYVLLKSNASFKKNKQKVKENLKTTNNNFLKPKKNNPRINKTFKITTKNFLQIKRENIFTGKNILTSKNKNN